MESLKLVSAVLIGFGIVGVINEPPIYPVPNYTPFAKVGLVLLTILLLVVVEVSYRKALRPGLGFKTWRSVFATLGTLAALIWAHSTLGPYATNHEVTFILSCGLLIFLAERVIHYRYRLND